MPHPLDVDIMTKLKDFVYHIVPDGTANRMAIMRGKYYELAYCLLITLPDTRERSLALTALEESSMRAIQCLAVSDGTAILPTLSEEAEGNG